MHTRTVAKRQKENVRRSEKANIRKDAARLFVFREMPDESGNTHVLWAHLPFDENRPLSVRAGEYVEFEALWNHEHLLDDLTEEQFYAMIPVVDDK